MADYTVDEYRAGARRAMEAGNTALAEELSQAGMALMSQAPVTAPAGADRFGRGMDAPLFDVSTLTEPQPQNARGGALMDVVRSGVSGLGRGATELAALPATIGGGLDALSERVGLIPAGSRANTPSLGAGIRAAGSQITSGGTEYNPQTTTGEYAQTVGEFVGGGAGAKAGVLGGLASEGAGQLTEGTALETPARIFGGLLGSIAATPRPSQFRGDTEAARMANTLEDAGVRNVTAGQMRGSEGLMRAEGRLAPAGAQLDDFTASTMRQLGSTERLATPETLRAVEQRIVGQMDDAVRGVDITPNTSQATRAIGIGTDYAENVPGGLLNPRVRGIANELRALAVSGDTVALSRLRKWRSDIGKLTTSSEAGTREAAHNLRQLIDEMTDGALTAAGRADDIASLAAARTSYRDFIGVRDASTRAGAERGTLSPTALNQSIIRSQGRESYALGRGTPMQDFSRAGAAILRPAPAVSPGSNRNFALPGGLAAIGGGAGFSVGGVPGAIVGAGAAQAAPSAGQAMMRSNAMQSLLRDPASIPRQATPMLPGLLAQEPQR
jgi:hypothetical protein